MVDCQDPPFTTPINRLFTQNFVHEIFHLIISTQTTSNAALSKDLMIPKDPHAHDHVRIHCHLNLYTSQTDQILRFHRSLIVALHFDLELKFLIQAFLCSD